MNLIKKYSVLIQIVGWLFYICMPLLTMPNFEISKTQYLSKLLTPFLVSNVFLIFVFYFNFNYLAPKFIFANRLTAYFFYTAAAISVCMILNHLVVEYLFPNQAFRHLPPPNYDKRLGPPPGHQPLLAKVLGPIFSYFLIILFSSMLALLSEKLKSDEEKKQIQLEKYTAELSVLKLQISPHFLFNTLNNIRWLARKKSDATEDAIVKLSTLLRYIIYQTNDQKVALSKEIGHLNDFISLQKMRISKETEVFFEVLGEIENKTIEPLLFIPFVENAFKFGTHENIACEIKIQIKVEDECLWFRTENEIFKKETMHDQDSSGLGINNVKQRLNLLYPETHSLKINESEGKYVVELNIKLNHG